MDKNAKDIKDSVRTSKMVLNHLLRVVDQGTIYVINRDTQMIEEKPVGMQYRLLHARRAEKRLNLLIGQMMELIKLKHCE